MRVLTILTTVLLAVGCSKTATIYLKDGTRVDGEIRRSDPSSVYVSSKDSDRVAAIYRGRVKEIDHPGNVHAIIGTTLGVVGWTAAIWGIVHEVGCEGMFCERGSVNGG